MEMYFIGEVRGFAGNFAPRNTAFCDGQLLAISQNDALFSIVGTIYGGDGRTSFGLPDLRGRAVVGQGQGPGLSNRQQGQKGGAQTVTLASSQMPSHGHSTTTVAKAVSLPADGGTDASGEYFAARPGPFYRTGGALSNMQNGTANATIGNTGGSQAHNNLSPYLGIRYIIALFGVYPSRN